MSWRLRLSVETILRLTPEVLGSTVFSIAGLCAAHACLDDQAAGRARGHRLQLGPRRRPAGVLDADALLVTIADALLLTIADALLLTMRDVRANVDGRDRRHLPTGQVRRQVLVDAAFELV
jgi:hypothetical protein